MCYSAQIWADFRKYERYGGTLDIRAFTHLAGWTRRQGSWTRLVPHATRRALIALRTTVPDLAALATGAEADAMVQASHGVEAQLARQAHARARLESGESTKTARNELRVASNQLKAWQRRLDELGAAPSANGLERIWPGHFAPVLIRDAETGELRIVPMRYRCRLPGWDAATERTRPGTYNARRDKLDTAWRRVFGVHHGVIAVHRFYESVALHDLQQRSLVPGERKHKVELEFAPHGGPDLLAACLWTWTEPAGDDPGFYSFAIITSDPPPEVALAGHDRCIVTLCEQDLDAWLNPTARSAAELRTILDRGEAARPHFSQKVQA